MAKILKDPNGAWNITKIAAVIAATLGVPSGGWAVVRLLDLDTVQARETAISVSEDKVNARIDENKQRFEILDGKINCILQDVPFKECPASQWRVGDTRR